MANDEICIGMIGSGFMGRTYSECVARHSKGARLVAVAGGQRAPKLAADYNVDHVPTVEELIERSDVDAVIISTPEMVHLEQTKMAASASKHVLVEKPMAPDVTQCDAMIEACNQAGVTLMVVQSQRFRGVHQRARKLIDEGRIGVVHQLRHWTCRLLQFSLEVVRERPFYLDPTGGGLFMGFSVHDFDMVRWLAGSEARSVFAHVTSYGDHPLSDLSMMAQIKFENGVIAQVWVCVEMPGSSFPDSQFHTQIVGGKGLLDFDGYAHLDLALGDQWERVWVQPPFTPPGSPEDPVRLESFVAQVQDFVDAICEGRPPAVTGGDGRAAVELCQAAQQSARTGQPVTLPL
jgi:predicted dehydrogenase